ncbi:MAG: hypothetical protein ACREEH_10090, partial [Caulobacteraceae bacterium]
MPEKAQVEGDEHQDDADVRDQPFPQSVSKEGDVDADDERRHRKKVEHGNYLLSHSTSTWASIHHVRDKRPGRGLARPERFERPTARFEVWCSI